MEIWLSLPTRFRRGPRLEELFERLTEVTYSPRHPYICMYVEDLLALRSCPKLTYRTLELPHTLRRLEAYFDLGSLGSTIPLRLQHPASRLDESRQPGSSQSLR